MTRPKLFHYDSQIVRGKLGEAFSCADKMLEIESALVKHLFEIDRHRLFVRLGYKSLRSFCIEGLKLTRIQAQRIVTRVRRSS